MRLVFGLVLLLGIGLAGFAVYMAQAYIGNTQKELAAARAAGQKTVDTVDVYTARRAIRYGEPVTEADVVPIAWPRNATPRGVFLEKADLFPEGGGARYALRAMEPGEPLLPVKLTKPGEDAGITSRLTPGLRAFTIQVNVTTGVAGFLRPTDRVDIFWTGRGRDGEVTRLIESGIRLIAVDQSADQDREERAVIARNVTVEAAPQQIAALAQAQASGRLSLALVGVMDDSVAQAVEVDQRSFLGIEVQEEQRTVAPEVCTVRTRRGAEVVEIPIPCTN